MDRRYLLAALLAALAAIVVLNRQSRSDDDDDDDDDDDNDDDDDDDDSPVKAGEEGEEEEEEEEEEDEEEEEEERAKVRQKRAKGAATAKGRGVGKPSAAEAVRSGRSTPQAVRSGRSTPQAVRSGRSTPRVQAVVAAPAASAAVEATGMGASARVTAALPVLATATAVGVSAPAPVEYPLRAAPRSQGSPPPPPYAGYEGPPPYSAGVPGTQMEGALPEHEYGYGDGRSDESAACVACPRCNYRLTLPQWVGAARPQRDTSDSPDHVPEAAAYANADKSALYTNGTALHHTEGLSTFHPSEGRSAFHPSEGRSALHPSEAPRRDATLETADSVPPAIAVAPLRRLPPRPRREGRRAFDPLRRVPFRGERQPHAPDTRPRTLQPQPLQSEQPPRQSEKEPQQHYHQQQQQPQPQSEQQSQQQQRQQKPAWQAAECTGGVGTDGLEAGVTVPGDAKAGGAEAAAPVALTRAQGMRRLRKLLERRVPDDDMKWLAKKNVVAFTREAKQNAKAWRLRDADLNAVIRERADEFGFWYKTRAALQLAPLKAELEAIWKGP